MMKYKILLVFLIHITIVTSGNKKRQNFGLIMDTSEDMGVENFGKFINFIENLSHHVSISLSNTRIAIATISSSFQLHSRLMESINRENLLSKLHKIRCCNGKSSVKMLPKAVRLLNVDEFIDRKIHTILLFIGTKYFNELTKTIERHSGGKQILVFIAGEEPNLSQCKASNITCINIQSADSLSYVISKLKLPRDRLTSCNVTGKIYDECSRHCDCLHGTMKNCYRIRKEFTQMTKNERRKYIKAYFKLTTQYPYKYRYEKFVYIHQKYFCYGIHSKNLFCPWHRFYILQMENLLKEIDCTLTLPYWDWSHVATHPWDKSGIWNDQDYGLGGNGAEFNGFCVTSGIFKHPKWKTPYFNDNLDIVLSTLDIYGDLDDDEVLPNLSDCLRRYFDGELPDADHVRRALNLPPENFTDFDINLRVNYHDTIHNAIGGTMCTHYAATAPEFFLHHTFLDKIWFMWQQKSLDHKFAFFANSKQKLMGFSHNAKELIDSHNLPGHVKVTYTKFPVHKRGIRSMEDQEDYSDDVNTPKGAVFKGIVRTATRKVFPSCRRKKSERLRAEFLDKLFSKRKD